MSNLARTYRVHEAHVHRPEINRLDDTLLEVRLPVGILRDGEHEITSKVCSSIRRSKRQRVGLRRTWSCPHGTVLESQQQERGDEYGCDRPNDSDAHDRLHMTRRDQSGVLLRAVFDTCGSWSRKTSARCE